MLIIEITMRYKVVVMLTSMFIVYSLCICVSIIFKDLKAQLIFFITFFGKKTNWQIVFLLIRMFSKMRTPYNNQYVRSSILFSFLHHLSKANIISLLSPIWLIRYHMLYSLANYPYFNNIKSSKEDCVAYTP